MTTDELLVLFVVLMVLLFLVIAAAILIYKPQQQMVPPQEKVIIFRHGRFHRIAGPGPVWFLSRIDTDEGQYNTSNRPQSIWVYNVRVHGIAAGLQLNLWLRTDLEAVAGNDRDKLAELALLKSALGTRQVAVEIKRVLDEALAALVADKRLPANAPLLARLEVLLPGTPLCAELLTYLKRELAPGLLNIGVILDPNKPISLVQPELPEDVVQALKRALLLDSLNEQLPDLPSDMRAQVAASIEGLQPLHIQELVVKSQGDTAGVVRDRLPLPDGSRVDLDLRRTTPADDAPAPLPPAAPTEALSQRDLQVLKRVSRDPRGYRKTA